MKHNHKKYFLLLALLLAISTGLATAQEEEEGPQVPEDLLEDEHVREEFGVNEFTTPSIRKLFEDLDELGAIPYDQVRRTIPKTPPPSRTKSAFSLGTLIADGFLAVQSEKIADLEVIGRSILKHSEALAAGEKVTRHTKSLLENSANGDWDKLREELSATQKDVEKEFVRLRSVDLAHLISLGGWLRAFDVACTSSMEPFNPDRAAKLARIDVAKYFGNHLKNLAARDSKDTMIQTLAKGVDGLVNTLDLKEGGTLTQEDVKTLQANVSAMIAASTKK